MGIGGTIYNVMMIPLEAAKLHRLRKKLVPQASGVVLEVGARTGVNISYYKFNQIKKLFHFVNSGWIKISRGCHLTRETIGVISQAGFDVTLVADGVFSAGWATKKEG